MNSQRSWDLIKASLRRMKYSGDLKNCNTLLVKAFYKSINRATTPEDPKSKTKARPNTIREIPLILPTAPINVNCT
jgi:hypothetical protein